MKNALIAAVVSAIVAAASGTAATIMVTSKNIKNGTIQTVDLSAKAKKALKGNRGLRGVAGTPGPAGPQGIQGAPGVQRVRFIVSPVATIPPNSSRAADAACPAGETAIAGGYLLTGSESALFQSVGIGTGWRAQAENSSAATDNATLVAYAYCASGVTFVP
jgi:hypothetical protein